MKEESRKKLLETREISRSWNTWCFSDSQNLKYKQMCSIIMRITKIDDEIKYNKQHRLTHKLKTALGISESNEDKENQIDELVNQWRKLVDEIQKEIEEEKEEYYRQQQKEELNKQRQKSEPPDDELIAESVLVEEPRSLHCNEEEAKEHHLEDDYELEL